MILALRYRISHDLSSTSIYSLPPLPLNLSNLSQPPNRAPRRRRSRCPISPRPISLPSHHIPSLPPLPLQAPKTRPRNQKIYLRNTPRSPRHRLLTAPTRPYPHTMSLHARFPAKRTGVAGVLADFHFLYLFAEGGAVSML